MFPIANRQRFRRRPAAPRAVAPGPVPHRSVASVAASVSILATTSALLASLQGCAPDDPNAFAPTCAPVGILAEAADYTDYGPNPPPVPDLGRIVSHGAISGVSGQCRDAKNGKALHTTIGVQMLVDRGPAARGGTIRIPYFIAVTRNGQLLRKLALEAVAEFPDNGDKVAVKTEPVEVELPVSREQPGTGYRFEIGFQLTESELTYNRAHPAH